MRDLNLETVHRALATRLEQLFDQQITDPAHPDLGAILRPAWGLSDAGGTAFLVASCILLRLASPLPTGGEGDGLLERANLAADYLLRAQRPSGLIDLRSCNYDSSPDTGFAVQRLGLALELARACRTECALTGIYEHSVPQPSLVPPDGPGRHPGLQSEPDRAGRPGLRHPGLRGWEAVVDKAETFCRRAVPGMLDGGFHTPNHRWVIASALAQAGTLFPELAVRPTIETYLAEGFDVDAEGAYIERSVGVYDAACNRSLLLLADLWQAEGALDAVRANLDFDLYLLHGDGTAETGLSRRQDYGTRRVPIDLAPSFLYCACLGAESRFAHAAQMLWERTPDPGLGALNTLCYVLLKYGTSSSPPHAGRRSSPKEAIQGGRRPSPLTSLDAERHSTTPLASRVADAHSTYSAATAGIEEGQLPDNYARLFPLNGIWRARRGPLSASVFRSVTRLLTLCYGRAELSAIKINQAYFADGFFVGDTLTAEGDTATLRSEGRFRPNRPGYDLPLGRPVSPEQWQQIQVEREYRPMPPATSTLSVTVTENGLELRYRTLDNFDGVAAQVALDLIPGGIWETEDTCFRPQAGQVIFLRRGYGSMRYGNDVIRIGPGAGAHHMWEMRHAETAPGHVRVLLTFLTPVDHAFALQCCHSPTSMM